MSARRVRHGKKTSLAPGPPQARFHLAERLFCCLLFMGVPTLPTVPITPATTMPTTPATTVPTTMETEASTKPHDKLLPGHKRLVTSRARRAGAVLALLALIAVVTAVALTMSAPQDGSSSGLMARGKARGNVVPELFPPPPPHHPPQVAVHLPQYPSPPPSPPPPAPCTPPPAPSKPPLPTLESPLTLATFDASSPLTWRVMNDPVMGGRSHSAFNASSGLFSGTCAVVPFLGAPGFCKMSAQSNFANASAFIEGALQLTVRSSTPEYRGFKVAWAGGSMPAKAQGWRHEELTFKASFSLPTKARDTFVTVRVPFEEFSVDWSEFTGDCSTRDPLLGGFIQHHCCSAAHPEVCPTAANLMYIHTVGVWAEGVEGDFDLMLRSIAVGP